MRNTVRSNSEIGVLMKNAKKRVYKTIVVYTQEHPSCSPATSSGRAAFIAGKRLGSAPMRNRAKRRMREAAAAAGAPWRAHDVLFIAKSTTAFAGFDQLLKDMEAVAAQLPGSTRG
ncbi:MAG: ribonuclease P protein component [Coriobacteriales bacterium]|jgi:ribonuclease P protein component|nr:ribonuclease P protein component [Coriobacteriales bacterium]